MTSPIHRFKLRCYKFWYRGAKNFVVQTDYMNCKILVRPNEDVGLQILLGNYEKNDMTYLLSQLKGGDIFFDIGANIGIFSLAVAKHNSKVKVHAFEPIPLNACLFQASLLLNEIESVKLNQSCVGDYVGDVEFSLASDSAYSSIHDTGRLPETKKIQTSVTTLDSYLHANNIANIDIMKIDVEGAEKLVLDGAKGIFSAHLMKPRLVLMELYDQNFGRFGTSIVEVVSQMKSFGYSPFFLKDGIKIDFHPNNHNVIYNVFFELDGK